MLKTESSGERTTLRSASPHRNAYRTEFQALKSTFDKPKSDGEQKTKEGEGSQQSRGRKYGSNVNRIKNLFMQMGMEPSENAAVIAKTRGKGGPSSPQRRMKPKEFLEKTDGSVVKLESSVSERISRFDTMYDGPSYSKFSETRKMFERSVHESGQNNRYSPKKEKAGGSEPQDEWGGSKSNRGSTDSLDSLSSRTEAVSPTVSQLSAVFENTDSPSAIISEKAENSEYSVTGHYPLNLPSVTVTNLDTFGHLKDSNSWSPPSKHSDDAEDAPKSTTSPGLEVASKSTSLASVPSEEAQQSKAAEAPTSSHEAPDRTDRDIPEEAGAESKAVPELEIPSPQNEPSEDAEARLVGGEAAMQQKRELAGGDFAPADVSRFTCEKDVFEEPHHFGSSHVYMHSDYNVYRVRSRYNSDWGETGTEQEEQEDSDENNYCQPDLEYSEIVGLPEEDDIPANRKIKFSSAPIKMCYLHSKDKYDLSVTVKFFLEISNTLSHSLWVFPYSFYKYFFIGMGSYMLSNINLFLRNINTFPVSENFYILFPILSSYSSLNILNTFGHLNFYRKTQLYILYNKSPVMFSSEYHLFVFVLRQEAEITISHFGQALNLLHIYDLNYILEHPAEEPKNKEGNVCNIVADILIALLTFFLRSTCESGFFILATPQTQHGSPEKQNQYNCVCVCLSVCVCIDRYQERKRKVEIEMFKDLAHMRLASPRSARWAGDPGKN
ncbi:hypothetical protein FD755_012707 [Muntiacus reevesi]|uniref:Neurabin-1/2 PDZ domain-containing protein n=1 Tax=Muntiacus reevesi TaxID=9886 RepID=A0A5N3XPN4_MUNRE|nr:hypothetical protein FD755_012707 [Muntiacus reevesi]